MAPTRSKKRKSTESTSSVDIQNLPNNLQAAKSKVLIVETTPINRSPIKKQKMGITLGQRQALIDNLQLEITERARKLRAQYMLQAQGLRTRIEIRVNRIPVALRKEKMGNFLLKYNTTSTRQIATSSSKLPTVPSPAKAAVQVTSHTSPSPQRGQKRLSDDMGNDKENENIENPKKRQRGVPEPPARSTSRAKVQPSTVLSPRSANGGTIHRSPVHTSPAKSTLTRPVSPLKPTAPVPVGGAAGILTGMAERAKPARGAATARKAVDSTTGAGRGKRAPPPTAPPSRMGRGRASTISDSSDGSTATVVRKPVKSAAAGNAQTKKGVINAIKGMGNQNKMPAAVKSTASAATGGRVLRKRN